MTNEELLAAVADALAASENPEGFYSTHEWADMFGLGENAARKRIKKLMRAGYIQRGSVRRVAMNGVEMPVSAYRFIPEEQP